MNERDPQTASADEQGTTPDLNGDSAPDERGRSTISFPYSPLKDAEQIAHAVHDEWGGSARPEQLAAGLDQTPRSGAFRIKVATARIFGVVAVSRGNISLTELGRRIVDPQTRADARVEAFLNVPLFKKIHDEYKASVLPADRGLEERLAEFGVSPKQTGKARQAFQRSAELAGFFKQGKTRLVLPSAKLSNSAEATTQTGDHQRMAPPQAATTNGPMPSPVAELWLTLLRDGRNWSAEKTQEFVEAARKLNELLKPD